MSMSVIGPTCVYNDDVVMPMDTGVLGLESETAVDDDGQQFVMELVLAWVNAGMPGKLSSLKFRRIGLLLKTTLASYMTIDIRKDFQTDKNFVSAIVQTKEFSFPNADTPQEQTRLERFRLISGARVVSSLELTIQDISGELKSSASWELSGIEFEVAPRSPGFGRPAPQPSGS